MPRHAAIIIAMTLSTILASGCATWRVDTTSVITAADYKPAGKKRIVDVKVFMKNLPASPYTTIGTIHSVGVEESEPEVLVRAVRQRAAKMGADAIVDVKFGAQTIDGSTQGGMICPTFMKCTYMEHNSTIGSVPTLDATAIVFTAATAE